MMKTETEWERTERVIIEALAAAGDWMSQREIRKATGLPVRRVENFTLSMALEHKIERTLTPDHMTQLFRVLGGAEQAPPAVPAGPAWASLRRQDFDEGVPLTLFDTDGMDLGQKTKPDGYGTAAMF